MIFNLSHSWCHMRWVDYSFGFECPGRYLGVKLIGKFLSVDFSHNSCCHTWNRNKRSSQNSETSFGEETWLSRLRQRDPIVRQQENYRWHIRPVFRRKQHSFFLLTCPIRLWRWPGWRKPLFILPLTISTRSTPRLKTSDFIEIVPSLAYSGDI